jgi:hypothetical protein
MVVSLLALQARMQQQQQGSLSSPLALRKR